MQGQRLKLARSAAGLSLRGLSARIGFRVTAQAIGKYERGESTPSSEVLAAISDALSVSMRYLTGDKETTLTVVEFRKKKIATKREENQVKAGVMQFVDRYLMVEEYLGLTSVNWDKPREVPYPVVSNLDEADRAAHSLRRSWGLGLDPIPSLMELVEEHGIKVLSVSLVNIDGLMALVNRADESTVPVIVVNRDTWGERQRLTMAHELGHLVMDVSEKIDEEKAAYRFAGAFLMPAEVLWAAIGKHRTSVGWEELFELKQLFGVSVQALTYRCKELGIFSDTLYRHLFRAFTRLGWRRPPYQEPISIDGEVPKRYERLCLRALSEGALSDTKVAELLNTSTKELNRRMTEPPQAELPKPPAQLVQS